MLCNRGKAIYPDLYCILCSISDNFVIPQQKIVCHPCKVKQISPSTGYEGPEGELWYGCTLSETSALDRCGVAPVLNVLSILEFM
jgi:hypothetical protein